MSEDLIAEGRRLIEAATPGPLEVDAIDPYDVITRHYGPVAEHESWVGATLHVFAVNNLAALLDVAEAGARLQRAYSPDGLTAEKLPLWDALDSALSKLRVSRAS